MTPTSSRSRRRLAAWSVPVVVIATLSAAVTAANLLPTAASASTHPNLPVRSAAQLLAAVQTADVKALSGTIVETARLGLPSLPGADNAAALRWQTLVAGTHTARIWLDGPDRQRLALLGTLAESDVVHNGRDLWTYASNTQKVGHTVLPAETPRAAKTAAVSPNDLTAYTPQGAAAEALKAIDPSTVVTVDRTARVAGQPAYTLVLTPRDTRSTVRKVLIAIDAKRSVPLRVQVFGVGSAPAFETAFTDVSFSRPASSVFRFTAPRGATVTNDLLGAHVKGDKTTKPAGPARRATPVVLGAGWTSVLALPAASSSGALGGSAGAASLLARLTTTLPNGDKLLRSALVNVLTTHDGRTFVGAVTPSVLQQAAAGQLR